MGPRLYGSAGGREASDRAPVGDLGRGLVAGVVALGAGLAVAEVAVGVAGGGRGGASSPVVAVGQAVIDGAPPALKDWAIATFGTANKVVLVVTTVVVLALVAGVAGTLAVRRRFAAAATLTVGAGLLGLLVAASRPGWSVGHAVPTVIGTAVAVLVLWWLPRRPAVRPAVRPAPTVLTAEVDGSDTAPAAAPMGVDRRSFFLGSALVAAAAVAAGGFGRLLQRREAIAAERSSLALPRPAGAAVLPVDADLGVDGVTPFVTPNDGFFRIDTALSVPQVSVDDWRLRVHGMVAREVELTFDDLLDLDQVERFVTLSCVSNEVGGSLVGNARWQGVRLADVLRRAGVDPAAEQLVSRSVDGWTCGTPVAAVLDGRDALLAVAMNGEPLPARHGYPVRMVVPGLFGYVSATKWVTDIELTTWDAFDAYWVRRGWAEQAPVKTMTRIDRPRSGSRVDAGPVDLGGVAWAVHRGISAVEVRVDGGPWQPCDLGGVPSDDTWRQWRHRWDATAGEHVIEARAVDGHGEVQPAEPRPPAPDGAQGHHRVRVVVA